MEKEDIFGDAYEYLLEQFADETKKSGGNFFTPREVVKLLVSIVEPKEKMSYLQSNMWLWRYVDRVKKDVQRNGGNPRNLILEGQESNYGTAGMCKMNMVLHGVIDFKIEYGDVLR